MNLAQWWQTRTRHPEPIEAQKVQSQESRDDLTKVVEMLQGYIADLKVVTADLKAITTEQGGRTSNP